MAIEEADVAALTVLLSPDRLAALTQLTGSVKAAIELHQETLKVGSSMMNIMASIEISLRNSICENLSRYFGIPGWLVNPPSPFRWKEPERQKITLALDSARRAEYSKLSQEDKHSLDALAFPSGRALHVSHLGRAKARRAHIPVSDGKVIAELTFYTWKRVCGPDYEHSLWKPTLKRVFPCKKVKRSQVADHLENLYQARNRLAHHEPVLRGRFGDAINAIKFVAEHLHAETPTDQTPLSRLIAEHLFALEQEAQQLHDKLDAYKN